MLFSSERLRTSIKSMGTAFSQFSDWIKTLGSSPARKVVFFGLENCGRTTTVYRWLGQVGVITAPTIGFSVNDVSAENTKLEIWDTGGGNKIRPLWAHYTPGAYGLIWAVDSSDRERFAEVVHWLAQLQKDENLAGVPLLVLATKQDLPNAMSAEDLVQALNLEDIKGRKWAIQACNVLDINDDRAERALQWIAREVAAYAASIPEKVAQERPNNNTRTYEAFKD